MSRDRRQDYGEGSVYQRTDGRWAGVIEAGWTERGTRRRVTVTAPTEAAVRRKLRDRKAEIAKASGQVAGSAMARMTVKAWSEQWLPIRRATKRPNTYSADVGNVANWIVPTLGRKRLIELTARDVRAVEARIRGAGRGTPTVIRVQRTLVKMLRDAVEDGYPVQPAIFNISAPGAPANDREALETPQAIAVLGHAAELPHGTRWYVAFFEGLRQAEALGLTWDAVDFDAEVIAVEWQLQPIPYLNRRDPTSGFRVPHDLEARHLVGRYHLTRPKTKAGVRVVPMAPTVREALLAWRATWPENPHGLLFAREDGWPIDAKDDADAFRRLQSAAGVKHPTGRPYKGHEIRNTTATLLNEFGVDPVTITAILGHTRFETSRGYMNARSAPMVAAMQAVEAAFTAPAALSPATGAP